MTNNSDGKQNDQARWGSEWIVAALNPAYTTEFVQAMTDEELLVALAECADRTAASVSAQVVLMRTPGRRGFGRFSDSWAALSDRFTWAEIGAALGVGATTAQNRYRKVAPRERTR